MLNYFVYLRGQNMAQTWYIAIYTSKTNYREDLTRLNGYRKKSEKFNLEIKLKCVYKQLLKQSITKGPKLSFMSPLREDCASY